MSLIWFLIGGALLLVALSAVMALQDSAYARQVDEQDGRDDEDLIKFFQDLNQENRDNR